MSIKPKSKAEANFIVTVRVMDEGSYRLKLVSGQSKKFATVSPEEVIEWTDAKGYTFGIGEYGVRFEPESRGFYSRGQEVSDYISNCLSPSDWKEFATTLPAFQKLALAPVKKASRRLLAKYKREARYDGPGRPYVNPYPSWWAYDTYGKWVKVNGKTVSIHPDHLGEYLINQNFLEGVDENGYFLKGWGKRPKIYCDPRTAVGGAWNDAEWWEYAKTLKKAPTTK